MKIIREHLKLILDEGINLDNEHVNFAIRTALVSSTTLPPNVIQTIEDAGLEIQKRGRKYTITNPENGSQVYSEYRNGHFFIVVDSATRQKPLRMQTDKRLTQMKQYAPGYFIDDLAWDANPKAVDYLNMLQTSGQKGSTEINRKMYNDAVRWGHARKGHPNTFYSVLQNDVTTDRFAKNRYFQDTTNANIQQYKDLKKEYDTAQKNLQGYENAKTQYDTAKQHKDEFINRMRNSRN